MSGALGQFELGDQYFFEMGLRDDVRDEIDGFAGLKFFAQLLQEIIASFVADQRANQAHRQRTAPEIVMEIAGKTGNGKRREATRLPSLHGLDAGRRPSIDHRTSADEIPLP